MPSIRPRAVDQSEEGHRKAPHPNNPFDGMVMMPVIALASVCLLFILYRRAAAITYVVGNKLKTWTKPEGQIRLSEDEGPSFQSFVVDDQHENGDDDVITPTGSRPRSPQVPPPTSSATPLVDTTDAAGSR